VPDFGSPSGKRWPPFLEQARCVSEVESDDRIEVAACAHGAPARVIRLRIASSTPFDPGGPFRRVERDLDKPRKTHKYTWIQYFIDVV